MNSCIYQGQVMHRRFFPVENAFRYKLFMLCLDLSELDDVFRGRWLWSTKRFNLAWFRRSEHLGDPDEPLDQSVRKLVHERTGQTPQGAIRLLTQLRYFGFQMNPVSFFFCYDRNNELQHIVAEVNNTPWGEQHCYVLNQNHFDARSAQPKQALAKEFHVSPFLPMEMNYRWRISLNDDSLGIGIQTCQGRQRQLNVAMSMQRKSLTPANLRRALIRHPFMTGKIFAGIYWQAVRLWAKGTPFFPHPERHVDKTTWNAIESQGTQKKNV